MRTKSGLASARAKGKLLGRPKGSKNANGSNFEPFKNEIAKFLKQKIPVNSILKIINGKTSNNFSYCALRYYIENNL